jgi:hypothetical protein
MKWYCVNGKVIVNVDQNYELINIFLIKIEKILGYTKNMMIYYTSHQI